MLSPARENALKTLLEDDSEVVQEALLSEFERMGAQGVALLKALSRDPCRALAQRAVEVMEALGIDDTAERFQAFIESGAFELETGCILMERVVYPDTRAEQVCQFLDEVALRCKQLMVQPSSVFEQVKVISRVLLHEYGFRGNSEHFFDPDNSFLHRVIERRRGIPISLCIIYILVAQRCGLNLEPVGAPGRFLVGCFLTREPFYIDPFERGLIRTADDVREQLLGGMRHAEEINYLAPCPTRDVLLRCCRNLVHAFAHEQQSDSARLFSQFVNAFRLPEHS